MLLAKSCMKRYNIKHGTIKLGTLHEYRETEIEHIADRKEGYLTFHVKLIGTVQITSKWFNTIAAGGMGIGNEEGIRFPGKTSANFKKIDVVYNDGKLITLRDSEAIIQRKALNSFLFCMSQVRKTGHCADIFPEYDDNWFIKEMSAHRFGFALGVILKDAIIEGRASGNHLVPKTMPIDDFSVNLQMGLVQYVPREIHVTNASTDKLDAFINNMLNIAFTKPPIPFAKEREFRFNYTIVSGGKIVEPLVKFVVLDSAPLQDLILQVNSD